MNTHRSGILKVLYLSALRFLLHTVRLIKNVSRQPDQDNVVLHVALDSDAFRSVGLPVFARESPRLWIYDLSPQAATREYPADFGAL